MIRPETSGNCLIRKGQERAQLAQAAIENARTGVWDALQFTADESARKALMHAMDSLNVAAIANRRTYR